MIELRDIDGYKAAVNPKKVDYIQKAEMMGGWFTILYFAGGNRIIVDDEYERVKRMLDDALVAEV